MKRILILIFLTYFISAQSSYVLQRIDGIEGDVLIVEFDSNENIYVSSKNETNYFLHKLNSTKNKIWTIDVPARVEKIIINSQNVVYLITSDALEISLSILREETLYMEEIYRFWLMEPIFIDEEDNLYFNVKEGVALLRPNSSTPILIKNLEDGFNLYEEVGVSIDSEGNVYFPVIGIPPPDNVSFAIITKEAKQEDEPYAKIFPLDDAPLVTYVETDEENNAWIFTYHSYSTKISKFSNDSVAVVLSEGNIVLSAVMAVKNRVYVARSIIWEDTSPLFYLTSDGEVHIIPDLEKVDYRVLESTKIAADKEGNVYFGSYYSFDQGEIVVVHPNEVTNTWINFDTTANIYKMVLDENDDLWVNTYGQGIYYIKKGDTIPVKVSQQSVSDEDLIRGLTVNKKTNEVFVLSTRGLFFVGEKE